MGAANRLKEKIIKEISNDISWISLLPGMLDEICLMFDLDRSVSFKLHLVLDEVLSNIINYAYNDQRQHLINISFAMNEDGTGIVVEVEDDGIPFNPLEHPPPNLSSSLEDRQIGNLGIHIVRETMDLIRYERRNDRNILTMTKLINLSDR
jgi:serine/threonine-protein kinase RsbW